MEGYCAATRVGGNCQRGSSGAWPLRETTDVKAASQECLQRCAQCAKCKYVSVGTELGDCSWFARCDLARLNRGVGGFVTFAVNATIGSSVDSRNRAFQRRHRRAERQRATVNAVGASLQDGKLSEDEGPRPRQWRPDVLVLALGVLSKPSPSEAERRVYIRQTLRPLGRSGLAYKFIVGTRGAEALPPAQLLSREQARHGDV